MDITKFKKYNPNNDYEKIGIDTTKFKVSKMAYKNPLIVNKKDESSIQSESDTRKKLIKKVKDLEKKYVDEFDKSEKEKGLWHYLTASGNKSEQEFQKTNKTYKEYQKYKKQLDDLNYQIQKEKSEKEKISNTERVLLPFVNETIRASEGIKTSINKISGQNNVEVPINSNEIRYEKLKKETKNPVEKVYQDLTSSMGGIVPSMVVSKPVSSLITTGLSSAGRSYTQAKRDGKTEKEATNYGIVNGTMEAGLQKVLGGISSVYGNSVVGNKVNRAMSKLIKNPTVSRLASEAGSEFTEEYLQEILDPVVRNITMNEKNEFKPFTEEALYSGMLGALNSGLINSSNIAVNKIQQKKLSTPITPINNDIKKESSVADRVQFPMRNSNRYSASVIPKNNSLITTNNIPQSSNTVNNSNMQQSQNYVSAIATNDSVIQNNPDLPQLNPINVFESSAKQYNIDTSNDNIKLINTKLLDRGIKARFDVNQFMNTKENAFWTVNEDGTREVVFNPNADTNDLLENVAVHELYHDISASKDGQKIATELLEFAKIKEGYNEARKSLEQTYSHKYDINSEQFKTLIDEEVVASILGKKLGNQEFITSLTMEKPSVARKIYSWVVDKLNQLNKMTGYKSEKIFWSDVKNKFENGYKEIVVNHNDTFSKFSIQVDSKGQKYVNVDTDQDIFDGKSLHEQTKIAKRYILDKFKGKELTLQENKVSVTRKTANEYSHPKTNLQKNDASSKMKASTELDNLLKISKYKYSKEDDGRHPFAKDGWDYYETKFKVNQNEYTGLLNIAKNGEKKMLYDITKIKRNTQISSPVNTATESIGIPFSNKNIPQSNTVVKSSISPKYSMQTNKIDTSYRGEHQPSKMGYGYDLTSEGVIDDSIYTNPEWYSNMQELAYQESYDVLMSIRNKPNAQVTIYRATTGNDINPGDWITLSKTYAQDHLERSLNGKGKIIEKNVRAKDIQFAGDDINEFGYFPNENNKKSISDINWQEYLDNNYQSTGTGITLSQVRKNKTLNPNEITKLKPEIINNNMQQNQNNVVTLPISDEVRQKILSNKVTPTNEIKQSNLQENLNSSNLVNEKFKSIVQDSDMSYETITNKDTMEQAKKRLDNDINSEVRRLMAMDPTHATALDIVELIQLQYQYQQNMDVKGFQDSVDKLRQIGTNTGQAAQAFAILQRMSPEGMVYYAQRDLQSVFDSIAQSKNQKWIDKNKEKFNLNENDIKNIIERMNKVQELNIQKESIGVKEQKKIERQQKILLAEVQQIVNDKIPTNLWNQIKSFRRISMLFNPKTQIRNIVSNVLINPLNRFSDRIGAGIDRLVSNETGIRTTGATDYKTYAKGFKEGITDTIQDYKLGIDTDGIEMNKFDIGRGKSFNKNTQVGKVLNEIDRLNSTLLKLGDAPFFQAEFNNSLQNQMKLNNVKEPTMEMVLNAREVALERTWQDNNKYTDAVLKIRHAMNLGKEFGLGDIIIPFAKTPANFIKAMVDYSPIGFGKALLFDVRKLNNAISKGENVTTYQRKVVNNMAKGITGTMTYLLAIIMSNMITGERDKDKDTANFEKDILGIQPYSFKIGNRTFTYDWAMPLSTPFAIIADTKYKDGTLLDKAFSALGTMGDRLIEQSFLQGISNLFSNWKTGGFQSVAENLFSDLPASFVPTFLKQINDIIDPNQRIQYEKGNPLKTSYNKAVAKIPLLSKTLAPKKDVLGNDVKKFGGANSFFNVFINPANVNVAKDDEVGQEIKRLYEVTGSNTVVPKVAPYLLKLKQENITLNSKQQSEFQELSGKEANRIISDLLGNDSYLDKDDEQKADIITKIVNYAYNRAKEDMFNVVTSGEYESISDALSKGINVDDYLIYKESIDDTDKDTKKSSTIEALINSDLSDAQKGYLYSKVYAKTDNIINSNIPMNAYLTLQDRIKNIESLDDPKSDINGKTISGSKKRQVIHEIAKLPISNEQKLVLIALQGYSISSRDNIVINKQRVNSKQFRSTVFNYVNRQPLTAEEKRKILKQSGYKFYDNGNLIKNW